MDEEQERISQALREMREEIDGGSLTLDAERRGLLRVAIVELELLRARNHAKAIAYRAVCDRYELCPK